MGTLRSRRRGWTILILASAAAIGIFGCGDDESILSTNPPTEEVVPVVPEAGSKAPQPDPDLVPDEPAGAPEAAIPDDSASEFTSTTCEQLGLGITEITATASDCETAHAVAGESTGADYSAEGFECVVARVEKSKPNDFHHYVCTRDAATITFRARQ